MENPSPTPMITTIPAAGAVSGSTSHQQPVKLAFRVNTSQLFLTYDNCLVSKERVLYLLSQKVDVLEYVVATELHKSGVPHIHCYLKLARKVNIKDPHFFDLYDPETGLNAIASDPWKAYQGCRSPTMVWWYVRKGKDFISNMEEPPMVNPFTEAINMAREGRVEAALEHLEKKVPEKYLANKDRYAKALEEARPRYPSKKFELTEYPKWDPSWWDRKNKTLVLIGKAGVGKTELSKALMPKACYCRGMEKLKDYNPRYHEGIIFDDVDISHMEIQEQINVVDLLNDANIRILYRSITIPEGVPRIITSHTQNIMDIASFYDHGVKRRCDMVLVKSWDDMEKVDIDKLVESIPPPMYNIRSRTQGGGKFARLVDNNRSFFGLP